MGREGERWGKKQENGGRQGRGGREEERRKRKEKEIRRKGGVGGSRKEGRVRVTHIHVDTVKYGLGC